MKKYIVDSDHVIRHFDVTGKTCPQSFVDNDDAWLEFKANLNLPVTVRTTKKGVYVRDKAGAGYKKLGALKKGSKCIINQIKVINGTYYGHRKKAKNWIRLNNTTYKK